MAPRARSLRARKTDWRPVFVLNAMLACGGVVRADTDPPLALDRAGVLALAARAPEIAVAEAQLGEARARRVGSDALAPLNPDLTVLAGPRRYANGERSTDLAFTLLWPIDVSGSRSARKETAERGIAVAEADATNIGRIVAAEALELWIAARAAAGRVELETLRASLDADLLRIAGVRRQAGVAGDAELALANVLASETRARLQEAHAEESAAVALLKGKLGLPASASVVTRGALADASDAPGLPVLVERARERSDVTRAARAVPAAAAAAKREARSGLPVPRVLLGTGRENETFARAGLDLPLPFYQRNQTNRAIAEAHVSTANAELAAAVLAAETEVRAAHASYTGALQAFRTRSAALAAVADVEKLAWRGYELGSVPLASVVVNRREAATARAAHLESAIALARARVTLDRSAGALP